MLIKFHFLLEGEDSATKEGEGHDPMSYERPDQRLRSVKECLFQILHAILPNLYLMITNSTFLLL